MSEKITLPPLDTCKGIYTNAEAVKDMLRLRRAVGEIFDCIDPWKENCTARDLLFEAGRALDAAVKALPTEPKTPSFAGNVVPFRRPGLGTNR